MDCITPSNPDAIPYGESIGILECLAATSHGSLFADQRPMSHEVDLPTLPVPTGLSDSDIKGEMHRADGTPFLVAQTLGSTREVDELWRSVRPGRFPVRTAYQVKARRAQLDTPSIKSAPVKKRVRDSRAHGTYLTDAADLEDDFGSDLRREADEAVQPAKARRAQLGATLLNPAWVVEDPTKDTSRAEALFTDYADLDDDLGDFDAVAEVVQPPKARRAPLGATLFPGDDNTGHLREFFTETKAATMRSYV